jgi:hypothetical protein
MKLRVGQGAIMQGPGLCVLVADNRVLANGHLVASIQLPCSGQQGAMWVGSRVHGPSCTARFHLLSAVVACVVRRLRLHAEQGPVRSLTEAKH